MILEKVFLDVQRDLAITHTILEDLVDPWVFKELRDRGSIELVLVEALKDEALGLLSDSKPLSTVE